MRRVRHNKGGGEYYVLGHARLQSSGGPISEPELLTIYRSTQYPTLWARPTIEFEDGRFSETTPVAREVSGLPQPPISPPPGMIFLSEAAPVTVMGGGSVVIASSRAAVDVISERLRQVNGEGWTDAHDDAHAHGEIAMAAACYALSASQSGRTWIDKIKNIVQSIWPWDWKWWKPTNNRRDLAKAGALIIAEIERLDRIQARYSREQASASS